jgi:hypothetical protein
MSNLADIVREATRLRTEVSESVPGAGADPEGLHDFLRLCRAKVDRLEAILGELTLHRGRLEKAVYQHKGSIEDAEVAALPKMKPGDYTSAKERTVEFTLHSLDERREARKAETLLIDARTAHEYVRLLYWGVDNTRKETETRLRAITLVTSLER